MLISKIQLCRQSESDDDLHEHGSISSCESHEDIEAVTKYFNETESYSVYRTVVDGNYAYHREAYSGVKDFLSGIGKPFSFLDLGCGDADKSSEILSNFDLQFYHAVDISLSSLNFAEQNIKKRIPNIHALFKEADFLTYISSEDDLMIYDIIFIGLSLHHLPLHDKIKFLKAARKKLSKGGSLLIYEPPLPMGMNVTTYNDITEEFYRTKCPLMTAKHIEITMKHTRTADYPEYTSTYQNIGLRSGFEEVKILYASPDDRLSLIAFLA